ncbi:IS200/IS605 family transposase, partial [Streptomyces sp. NPDC054766]
HYPPKIALSKLVNSLKGVSSRYLRAEYTERIDPAGTGSVFWSPSYFAGSCGGAPLSIVKEYIESQKRPA